MLKQENDFQTWNSMTIKRSYAEHELMRIAHERKDRALISQSWITGLLPVKQVVLFNDEIPNGVRDGFFVLWNAGKCALCWKIKLRPGKVIDVVPDAASVVYKVISDTKDPKGGLREIDPHLRARGHRKLGCSCPFLRPRPCYASISL